MARERYLVGVDPKELQPQEKVEQPLTFWQKLDNFWFHYKWPVIAGVAVLVLAIVLGVAIGKREKYDYTIVTVTQGALSADARTELGEEIALCGEDLDGDGQVKVEVIALDMTDPGDCVELSSFFMSGNAVFFAMEPAYYEAQIAELETEDTHYFTKLNGTHPGLIKDARCWNWNGTIIQQCMEGTFPKDWYFGVRLPIGTAAAKEQESADCTALLERWIATAPMKE